MEKRKGFTLIELLVVIAIIALLLAILFPSLKRARNNARFVACQSNLKQWGTILEMHAETNQGRLFWSSDVVNGNPDNIFSLDTKYLDDVKKSSKISICPMAVKKSYRPFPDSFEIEKWLKGSPYPIKPPPMLGYGTSGSTFESWVWQWSPPDSNFTRTGSYGANSAFAGRPTFMTINKLLWEEFASYSTKGQSNIPVFLDSALPYSTFVWEGQKPPATEDETTCVINRHDGGVNSLFLDWSVRKVGLKELWKLKWHKEFSTNGPWTIAGGVKPDAWPAWMREFKDY